MQFLVGQEFLSPAVSMLGLGPVSSVLSSVYKGVSFVLNQSGYENIDLSVVLKLKRRKSSGIDQIPAKLIKVGSGTIRSEIHKLMNLIGRRRNCLRIGRSQDQ